MNYIVCEVHHNKVAKKKKRNLRNYLVLEPHFIIEGPKRRRDSTKVAHMLHVKK